MGSSAAGWPCEIHIISAFMWRGLFYTYIQTPHSSSVLTMWSRKTITNTTTHRVDKAAGKRREQTVVIVTYVYANLLADIRVVLMLL